MQGGDNTSLGNQEVSGPASKAFHLPSFETGHLARHQENITDTLWGRPTYAVEFATTCSHRAGDMTTNIQ